MTDKLIADFLAVINQVSYYNAGEGNSYWEESHKREAAKQRLKELKLEMVTQFGKEFTLEVANGVPHLCYGELNDLETTESR